jgi:hypothetical protein
VCDEREDVLGAGTKCASNVGGFVVLLVGIRERRSVRDARAVDRKFVLLAGRRVRTRANDRTRTEANRLAREREVLDPVRSDTRATDPRRVPVAVSETGIEARGCRERTHVPERVPRAHRPPVRALGLQLDAGRDDIRLRRRPPIARTPDHARARSVSRGGGRDQHLVAALDRATTRVVHLPAEGGRAGHRERRGVVVDCQMLWCAGTLRFGRDSARNARDQGRDEYQPREHTHPASLIRR